RCAVANAYSLLAANPAFDRRPQHISLRSHQTCGPKQRFGAGFTDHGSEIGFACAAQYEGILPLATPLLGLRNGEIHQPIVSNESYEVSAASCVNCSFG